MDIKSIINLDEFEQLAREILPRPTFDFLDGGAADEQTLRDNRVAFSRFRIVPRYLRGLDPPADLTTTVLGTDIAMPILTAPIGYQRMVHDEGDIGIARAAAVAKTVMVMSSMSNHSHAEVAKAVPEGIRWAQLYIFRDPGLTRHVIDQVADTGFAAVAVTVDGFINGLRERDMRSRFTLRRGLDLPCAPSLSTSSGMVTPEKVAEAWEPRIGWQHIEQCRSMTSLPVVLKGVLSPADAVEAVNRGVDAIMVSNHGGRQLDTVPATIDVLPAIAEAVGGRAELYLDGGVRRGTDVVKALALGARAILVGRPTAFSLAVGGGDGVSRMLEILANETSNALTLAGLASVREVTGAAVSRAS